MADYILAGQLLRRPDKMVLANNCAAKQAPKAIARLSIVAV